MRQSFNPEIWGPHAWFFLETVAMGYPISPTTDDKTQMKKFFNILKDIIPCEKCRINYKKHLKEIPLTNKNLENRDSLFKWIVDVHNSVDPSKIYTYEDTYNYYIDQYQESNNTTGSKNKSFCNNRKVKNIFIILMIITSIILIHKIYLYISPRFRALAKN